MDGTESVPDLHADDDKDYVIGFRSMQLFVERFYQYDVVRNLFFGENRTASIERDITGLLAGDLWTDSNAIQKALLEGRQARKSG